ncbi:hypothetical protein ACKQTC_00245 [Peptococcus simiae]|uniref:Uncharacterized protein n=1 Tax=Peptococcus simiae TaxID=1643805 RepID=A0ABW9GWD9_9FIRM
MAVYWFKRWALVLVVVCGLGLSPLQAADLPADGCYRVPVTLLHAEKDKPSMGAQGLTPEALVEVRQGTASLYLETQVISVTGLTTSLSACHYLEGGAYRPAEPLDYTLEIPGVKGLRPRYFRLTYSPRPGPLPVLVNPQVVFMGGGPLPARLQVDWSGARAVDSGALEALAKAEGAPSAGPMTLSASGLSLDVPAGQSPLPDLTVRLLALNDLEAQQAALGVAEARGWQVALFYPLDRVAPGDVTRLDQVREAYPMKGATLYLPKAYPQATVYRLQGADRQALALEDVGDQWLVHCDLPAQLVMVPGAGSTTPALGAKTKGGPGGKAKAGQAGARAGTSRQAAGANPAKASGLVQAAKASAGPTGQTAGAVNRPAALAAGEAGDQPTEADPTADSEDQVTSRENGPVIFTLLFIFFLLVGVALLLVKRTYPLLKNELDRLMYLRAFERGLRRREDKH